MSRDQIESWKKVRKDWGSLDPRERIKLSKKIYNRNKIKSEQRKEEEYVKYN